MTHYTPATEPISALTQPIPVVRGKVNAWRISIAGIFLSLGFSSALWGARIPEVRDALGIDASEVSILLCGVSAGSITGLIVAPVVMRRVGALRVLVTGLTGLVASMLLLAVVVGIAHSLVLACVVLFAFGGSMSSLAVTMNVEATTVEKFGNRALLPFFHACYSGGTVLGAFFGVLAAQSRMPLVQVFPLCAALILVTGTLSLLHIPTPKAPLRRFVTGADAQSRSGAAVGRRGGVLRDPALLLLGLMVLGMSFVEGTATDWLNLAAVDGHHLSAAGGGIAFAAFMAGMLLGRVSGGMLLDRLGRRTTLLITGTLAVFGVVAFLFSPSPQLIAVASAVWGIGASLGFPVGMSIAADRPGDTSAQVSTVSVFGYAASLVGPLVIGLASAQFGLLPAFGLVLGASALSLLIVPFVTRATR